MRDPARIDKMLKLLGDAWKKHPDIRLGQLIDSIYIIGKARRTKAELFCVEDDVMELMIGDFVNWPNFYDRLKDADPN